jgi:hypothetical protein
MTCYNDFIIVSWDTILQLTGADFLRKLYRKSNLAAYNSIFFSFTP